MAVRHQTIADEILRTIKERGPQDVDDLTKVVVAAGLTRASVSVTPEPALSVSAAVTTNGGQVCAQMPVEVLVFALSALKVYRVRPSSPVR